MNTFTVLSTPACSGCVRTVSKLKAAGADMTVISAPSDPEAAGAFQEEFLSVNGYTAAAAPVVMVKDHSGRVVDSWSGYDKDRLSSALEGELVAA